MHLHYVLSILGLAAVALAQTDSDPYAAPCGSAKTCIANCPNQDFFPQADECDTGDDGKPYCYVSFWCA